ncbi:amidohydrolase [Galactobacter sp.]|uniref:amidohydrolase n=1 Tax=Galactobacter sp. TaxID=2676125 RepID=UPI0025C5D191|nr:amidohydrolase family protein [Galactobacter sp.]
MNHADPSVLPPKPASAVAPTEQSQQTHTVTLFTANAVRATGGILGNTVAVADGKVVAIGDLATLREAHPSATIHSYEGATITAGLIDGHAHPAWGTMMARGVGLQKCETYDQVVDAIKKQAQITPDNEWVFAWGLEPHMIGGTVTNDFLHDALGPDRPAYVACFDAHSAVMSAAALREAGINEPQDMSDGGGFTAREDSTLTGHVLEFMAMNRADRGVPPLSIDEFADRLGALLDDFAANGITAACVADAQGGDRVIEVLQELENRGELPIQLRISPWCTPDLTEEDVRNLAASLQPATAPSGRRWRFEGVKMFIDGTIDNGTAWLDTPDTMGDGLRGFWQDPATYTRNLNILNEAHVPTITHAIGEAGVRHVAQSIAALPDRGVLHRMDHLETIDDETIDLIAEHRIPVCVQPTHCTLFVRPDGADSWSERLGPARRAEGYKIRTFVERGIVEALGSDWPVAPYDPRAIMADSRLRHRHDGGEAPISPGQVLSAQQVLTGYTAAVTASIGAPGGDLRVGEPADMTIWSADPVAASAEELPGIDILDTVIGGTVVEPITAGADNNAKKLQTAGD